MSAAVATTDRVPNQLPHESGAASPHRGAPVPSWLGLAAIMILGASLRLWGIAGDAYGNAYFSAGVRIT